MRKGKPRATPELTSAYDGHLMVVVDQHPPLYLYQCTLTGPSNGLIRSRFTHQAISHPTDPGSNVIPRLVGPIP